MNPWFNRQEHTELPQVELDLSKQTRGNININLDTNDISSLIPPLTLTVCEEFYNTSDKHFGKHIASLIKKYKTLKIEYIENKDFDIKISYQRNS